MMYCSVAWAAASPYVAFLRLSPVDVEGTVHAFSLLGHSSCVNTPSQTIVLQCTTWGVSGLGGLLVADRGICKLGARLWEVCWKQSCQL
jgi:hypothetical protein